MPSSNSANFGKMFQASQLTNSILDKVAKISESNSAQMAEVVSGVSTTAATMGRVEELLTVQNKILLTIAENTTRKDKGTSPFGFAFKDLGEFGKIAGVGAGVAATMIAMTGAVVASATLIGMINVGTPVEMLMKFGVALATVGVLYLMATPFTEIIRTLSGITKTTSAGISSGGADATVSMGGADIMGMIGAVGAGAIAMLGMSAVVVMTSKILSLIDPDPALIVKAGIGLLVSIAMIPMAWAFTQVLQAISGMQSSTNVGFEGMELGKSGTDIGGMFAAVGAAGLAMIGMAAIVVGTTYMLKLIPTDISLQQIGIAALVALAMVPMAYSFKLIAEAIAPIASNPIKLLAVMGAVAVAFPLIIGSMAAGLQLWNLMAPDTFAPMPEGTWLLKFGFMALIAAGSFALIATVAEELTLGTILLAAAALPLMIGGFALAIKVWAWTTEKMGIDTANLPALPPIEYILHMAAAATLMAIPAFVLSKVGLQGILVGSLGIVAMLGAMGGALWAFDSLAPENPVAVAKMISDSVMQPFYAIVDFVKYFSEQIPTDKAGGIAVALLEIGGAYALFAGAVTGASVVSGIGGAIGNLVTGVIDWAASLFGAEESKSAADILVLLANNAPKIQALAKPLADVGVAFGAIAMINQVALEKAKTFLENLNEYDFSTQARDLTKIATAYTNLSKASNEINIEGMTATKEMFMALDNLAKSGGSDAIDSMKELLVETLEALADAVHTMTTDNTTLSESLGNTITAVTNAVGLTKPKAGEGEATSDQSPIVQSNQQLLLAMQELKSRLDGNLYVEVQNIDNLRG